MNMPGPRAGAVQETSAAKSREQMTMHENQKSIISRAACLSFFGLVFLLLISGCARKQPAEPSDGGAAQGDGVWRSIGPFGMDVSALTMAPDDALLLFAATDMGNLFESVDGGASWQKIAALGTAIRDVIFDPRSSQTVYVGLDLFGVQKSIDGGVSWGASGSGLQFDPFVYDLVFHPGNPDILYAATFKSIGTGGVYISRDAGKTWQLSSNGIRDEFVLSLGVVPADPNLMYAGTFSGTDAIYKSTDAGANWSVTNNGLGRKDVFAIVIHPLQPEIVYLATSTGIYRSTNGGLSWRPKNSGLTSLDVRALVMDPRNPLVLYASGGLGIFKSTDGGESWMVVNSGLTNRAVVKLVVDPTNSNVVYGGAVGVAGAGSRGSFLGGVFKSTSAGEAWASASRGLLSQDVRAIAIVADNPDIIYAGTFGRGVFRSDDGGSSWNSMAERYNVGLDDPQILDLDIDPRQGNTVLAATFEAGIFRTDDGGKNWRSLWRGGRVQTIARDPKNPDVLFAASFQDGMLKSSDGGQSWVTTDFDKTNVFAIAIDPHTPSTIYAGVNESPPAGGVFKSLDGGLTWEHVSAGMTNTRVRALAIHPENPQIVYAGTLRDRTTSVPPILFRSEDGGKSWKPYTEEDLEAFVLLINPENPDILYSASLGEGVSVSRDGGRSWSKVNEGLFNPRLLALEFDPLNANRLYAGSVGDAIFRVQF